VNRLALSAIAVLGLWLGAAAAQEPPAGDHANTPVTISESTFPPPSEPPPFDEERATGLFRAALWVATGTLLTSAAFWFLLIRQKRREDQRHKDN